MRRLGSVLIAVAFVLGLVGLRVADADSAPAAPRAPQRPVAAVHDRGAGRAPTRVSLYGDSLAYQARSGFVAWMAGFAPGDLRVSTFPTTALCDYRTAILRDLLQRRPEVVILSFSGNSFTPCMRDGAGAFHRIGSAGWRERYLGDLRDVLTVAGVTNTRVLWATAPPVVHPPEPDDYPRLLGAAARRLAGSDARLRVVDAGDALTRDDHSFVRSLPCRVDERNVCYRGRIQVRASDGLHFDCRGARDPLGACLGYSAGGRRYGEALAAAVIAVRVST